MGEDGVKKDKEFIGMNISDYVNLIMERRRQGADFPSWEDKKCYICDLPLTINNGVRVPSLDKDGRINGFLYSHKCGCPSEDYNLPK